MSNIVGETVPATKASASAPVPEVSKEKKNKRRNNRNKGKNMDKADNEYAKKNGIQLVQFAEDSGSVIIDLVASRQETVYNYFEHDVGELFTLSRDLSTQVFQAASNLRIDIGTEEEVQSDLTCITNVMMAKKLATAARTEVQVLHKNLFQPAIAAKVYAPTIIQEFCEGHGKFQTQDANYDIFESGLEQFNHYGRAVAVRGEDNIPMNIDPQTLFFVNVQMSQSGDMLYQKMKRVYSEYMKSDARGQITMNDAVYNVAPPDIEVFTPETTANLQAAGFVVPERVRRAIAILGILGINRRLPDGQAQRAFCIQNGVCIVNWTKSVMASKLSEKLSAIHLRIKNVLEKFKCSWVEKMSDVGSPWQLMEKASNIHSYSPIPLSKTDMVKGFTMGQTVKKIFVEHKHYMVIAPRSNTTVITEHAIASNTVKFV